MVHAQTRIDALSFNSGEDFPRSSVIDTATGFAYFGTDTSPGIIVKVRLSDFSRVDALTLASGENNLRSAAIDHAGTFAYFGTDTKPGIVVKIRLSDFARVDALRLNLGEGGLISSVIDATGYAYFGTDTSPGIVVKIRLSDFTRVGALTLRPGEENLASAVIDPAKGYAYFGTRPGVVVKIKLSDLSRVSPLTLNPGEGDLRSAVIDADRGFAYFGTYTTPGIIVKVGLSNFARVGALTDNSFGAGLVSAVIDSARGFAYFGVDTGARGLVAKVGLSEFKLVGVLTNTRLEERYFFTAVIDTDSGFGYFATYTQPGIIVKVSPVSAPPSTATSSIAVTSNTTPVVPNPALGMFGLPLEFQYGLGGAIAFVAIISATLVLAKRKKGLTSNSVSMEGIASTGYADLDHLLAGGVPAGYSVLFLSPPFDERDLLFRRIIASSLSSGMQAFYISSDISRTKDLVGRFQKGFYAFCPAASKISAGYGNLYEIPDVGNLVEFNILLNQALGERAKESKTNVIVVDILSDVLLRHRGLVSRKWLSEFIGKRKAQSFTIFGTINPLIAPKEETDRVVDLFDGVIEIYEKQDSEGRLRRFLAVKKMYGQKYSETELIIDKNKLF